MAERAQWFTAFRVAYRAGAPPGNGGLTGLIANQPAPNPLTIHPACVQPIRLDVQRGKPFFSNGHDSPAGRIADFGHGDHCTRRARGTAYVSARSL